MVVLLLLLTSARRRCHHNGRGGWSKRPTPAGLSRLQKTHSLSSPIVSMRRPSSCVAVAVAVGEKNIDERLDEDTQSSFHPAIIQTCLSTARHVALDHKKSLILNLVLVLPIHLLFIHSYHPLFTSSLCSLAIECGLAAVRLFFIQLLPTSTNNCPLPTRLTCR